MLTFYSGLLRQGWHLNEIDDMDILYYLRVLAKADVLAAGQGQKQNRSTGRAQFIDEVWPSV